MVDDGLFGTGLSFRTAAPRSYRIHQLLHVGLPIEVDEGQAIAKREVLQIVVELIGAWHDRATDEDGDDRQAATLLQRRSDFLPHRVAGIVEAPLARRIVGCRDVEPLGTNHGEEDAARRKGTLNRLAKVEA